MSRRDFPSGLPVEVQERIKNISDIYKIVTTKLTPISKSYPLYSTDAPRVEIMFPNDAVLNFNNAILEAELTFWHKGNAAAGSANNYVQSVYPPRYGLASLIQEFNVYINGQTVSKTSQYNYIHNWINDWLQNQELEIIDNGLNTVDDPSKLYSYHTTTGSTLKGYVVPRRGFPASAITANTIDVGDVSGNTRMKNKYHMNLSESLGFFGESSTKIINTAFIGEIKLEIIFSSQVATCILGSAVPAAIPVYEQKANSFEDQFKTTSVTPTATDDLPTTATKATRRYNIQKYTSNFTTGDCGVPTPGNADAAFAAVTNAAAVAADAVERYQISSITLYIEALQFKTSDYYDVMNRLIDSGNYKIHFKRYVLYNDATTTDRGIDYRVMVNSECLNYVLATFRPNNYTTLSNPVNTLISPVSTGHTGVYQATIDNQIAAGLPYTFNNSKFFIRNGQRISRLGFKIDETPIEPKTHHEMYIENLRHWRNYIPGKETRPYKGLKNIYDFINCFYTGLLSCETKSEDDVKYVYPLRGYNTNGKTVAIGIFTEKDSTAAADLYTAQAGNNENGFSNIDLDPGSAATPTFLVCTTMNIMLNGRRNVEVKY